MAPHVVPALRTHEQLLRRAANACLCDTAQRHVSCRRAEFNNVPLFDRQRSSLQGAV